MVGMDELVEVLDVKFRRDERRTAQMWIHLRDLEERVERAEGGMGRIVRFLNRICDLWSYLVVRSIERGGEGSSLETDDADPRGGVEPGGQAGGDGGGNEFVGTEGGKGGFVEGNSKEERDTIVGRNVTCDLIEGDGNVFSPEWDCGHGRRRHTFLRK